MKYERRSVHAALVGAVAVLMALLLDATAVAQPAAGTDHLVRSAGNSEVMEFALTLPLRNQNQLQQEIKDLYDPKSPQFRKFIEVVCRDANHYDER